MIKNKEFAPKLKGEGKLLLRARMSYVHLSEMWAGNENAEKKYSVSCIIPKDDEETVKAIRQAVEKAKEEGKAKKWGGTIPRKLTLPLRDGDEEREEDEAYNDCYFFSASSNKPVKVFDRGLQEANPDSIYSGCWGIVSVKFFPYDAAGNKGVGVGLNQVMFWADGDPLGGGSQGNDFEGVDGLEADIEDVDNL